MSVLRNILKNSTGGRQFILLVERATQQNVLQSIEASSLHTFEVSDTLFRSESTEFFLEAVLFVDPVGSTARRQGLPEGKPAMKCWGDLF